MDCHHHYQNDVYPKKFLATAFMQDLEWKDQISQHENKQAMGDEVIDDAEKVDMENADIEDTVVSDTVERNR